MCSIRKGLSLDIFKIPEMLEQCFRNIPQRSYRFCVHKDCVLSEDYHNYDIIQIMQNSQQGSTAIIILSAVVVVLIGVTIFIATSPVNAEAGKGITNLQNTPQ